MKTLTVFTPAYNRADLLRRGYQALCHQTSHDFLWLIIDDGSQDNTRELVMSWLVAERLNVGENYFDGYSKEEPWLHIRYQYKENGGLHTAVNLAIKLIDTAINVCIDSDDYMPDDAVENIVSTWNKCKVLKSNVAGVIGLDYIEGKCIPIGGIFKNENQLVHLSDIPAKCHHIGDTKIVCRTDLLKKYAPMPVFKGERNGNPIYLYIQVDNDNVFWVVNKNFCNVEYQENGMTANIFNQFYNSPHNFAALRELNISQHRLPLLFRFRNAIHFGSSIIFTSEYSRLFQKPSPVLKLFAFPLGILLNIYIRYKRHK